MTAAIAARSGAAGRGVDDRGEVAEVVGAEDAWSDDRERRGVDIVRVVEVVDGAARDAEHLAGADVDRHTADRPGQDSLQSVDRLLVTVVAVGDGDLRAGGNVELEDCDGAARLLALDQEPDRDLPDVISSCVLTDIIVSSLNSPTNMVK